jgi:hypothetical protein
MVTVMNMALNREAAARHRPIARGPGKSTSDRDAAAERKLSETKLQAAVAKVREGTRDERDPYADVPCTD